MPTTIEAKEAKRLLAENICMMIRNYEFTYDVSVLDVSLIRSQTLSDPVERTVAVEVMVEI